MIDVALMIEGQNGLSWLRWQRLARAAEELGFAGLYRSDHYTNANPPDKDSLELWVSLTWLASHTSRIEFGPIVSPVSFRHPTMTARMAVAVDDLSGGRLQLGLGAGWQAREHMHYGWDLLEVPQRFKRFEEGLEVITRLLRDATPVDFEGEFFRLYEAVLLPRPARAGGPPIVIGGNGPRRTLPLAARYADEWNAVFVSPARFAELSAHLDELLVAQNRQPAAVRRTLMAGTALAADLADAERQSARSRDELRARGIVFGSPADFVEQIGKFAEAGVQRIMLQWLDLDNIAGLERIAAEVLPFVSRPE